MSKSRSVPARHSERRMAELYPLPIGEKGTELLPLQRASQMEWPLPMTRAAVSAYVPKETGIYLMLVLYEKQWLVCYVGKSTDLRARIKQHLRKYGRCWVCWRSESRNVDALYRAECCEFRRYGGIDVLDNRCAPARPRHSRGPRCGALACPVPRRAAWAA